MRHRRVGQRPSGIIVIGTEYGHLGREPCEILNDDRSTPEDGDSHRQMNEVADGYASLARAEYTISVNSHVATNGNRLSSEKSATPVHKNRLAKGSEAH